MATDIAALIGSRICHDLISPIGAIGNGIELMSLSHTANESSPELDLITQSVQNANARIRFFRIAYGPASDDQLIGRQEVISVLNAVSAGGRLKYKWALDQDQTRQMTRIIFLILQCFETAMPLGGSIDITHNGTDWEVIGKGARIALDPLLWASFNHEAVKHTHTPAQVQFILLPTAIAAAGRKLAITHSADTIVAKF